ncbi:MAG: hypothetical protein K2R98_25670 [Gemmataceae bacterium]|nr:hypothetical protein [Gemmataceae bacterium]
MRTSTLTAMLAITLAVGCQQSSGPKPAAGPVAMGKTSGWEIKYTATVGLARRGSDLIKERFDVLNDMLDEDLQLANCRTKTKEGQEIADEQAAKSTVVNALKAIAELHRKRPDMDLSKLTPAIDKLTQSQNPVLKTEAERTRIALSQS